MQDHHSSSGSRPSAAAARGSGTAARELRVCFVCSGNICRSPIAEFVFQQMIEDSGLVGRVSADSAGTGDWHIGEGADRRALEILARHGYDGSRHRARQFEPNWFDDHSLVIALDHGHLRTLRAWAPTPQARDRVHLLRGYDPKLREVQDGSADGWQLDVPDPYYDDVDAFEEVLGMVRDACQGLLDAVRAGWAD